MMKIYCYHFMKIGHNDTEFKVLKGYQKVVTRITVHLEQKLDSI